jgi:drug/metabolite transporter (DMT)-like permease
VTTARAGLSEDNLASNVDDNVGASVERPPPPARRSWQGLAAVLLGASSLGLSAIFVRWAVAGGATVLSVGLYRMVFALPGALLLAMSTGGLGARAGRPWALAAGGAFFLDLAFWHQAMAYTTAANATLLLGGLSPIWVALFSVLVFRLRYRWLAWLGQALGLGGALVLALARGARGGTGRGELFAFIGSFAYAAFTLMFARSRRTLGAPQSLLWMSIGCCVCFLIATLAAGHPLGGYQPAAWLSLVALALIVQLFAWWLNSWGLGHVDVAAGALALQAQQVATLFLAAWLLAEPVRALGLVGGALLVVGIVLVTVGSKPSATRR